MRVLISYSTNSGSTYVVARTIAACIKEKKYEVTLKPASLTHEIDIAHADIICFGSTSWLVNDKEGQPHETMLALLERINNTSLSEKRFLMFGCGDSSYTHFCGAVDVLENWANTKQATLLLPSLRLDEFFFHEQENLKKVRAWTENVIKQHLKK